MKYDIFSGSAPAMPKPGKGTEIIRLYTSQVSPEMREAITPMPFSALASHLQGVKVMYSSGRFLELHGQINHFIGPSGVGKDQLDKIVESICRSFRAHDEIEMQKIAAWQAKFVRTRMVMRSTSTSPRWRCSTITLLKHSDMELLDTLKPLGTTFHMYPDKDEPGERLFLQLKEILPDIEHHQLPLGCKDYSDYYVQLKTHES